MLVFVRALELVDVMIPSSCLGKLTVADLPLSTWIG